jgi:hypothetical protein
MKTILHPDYWVEIPAGKFIVGLSLAQRASIIESTHNLGMYASLSEHQLQLLASIRQKHWQRTEFTTEWFRTRILTGQGDYNYPGVYLTNEENDLYLNRQLMNAFYVEMKMHDGVPLETEVHLDRFYIARFPVTKEQYLLFNRKTPINNIAGALEPEHEAGNYSKRGARVHPDSALPFCTEFGGRLPTALEWEKAARGIDGRLYPWGNEWDLSAGDFYYGQVFDAASVTPDNIGNKVDSYPKGVSPYGVWRMVGSEPELVMNIMGNISSKGYHPKESFADTAWLDHMIPMPSNGNFVALRPVLDKWPVQQWQGAELQTNNK